MSLFEGRNVHTASHYSSKNNKLVATMFNKQTFFFCCERLTNEPRRRTRIYDNTGTEYYHVSVSKPRK